MHNSFSAYVLPCTSRVRFGSVSPSLGNIFPSRRFSEALIAFYTLRCTWKSHTPTVVQGGRGWWNPCPSSFLRCCSISKQFGFRWKAFDLLDKMRYTHGWWPCCRPVTSSRLPSWILPKSRNQARKARKWFFLLFLTCKWHINKYFASFYLEALLLSLKKKVEKNIFT